MPIILAVGGEPLGIYYAAQSLKQLLTVQDGNVLLRRADITDYPSFEHRSTYCSTVAEAEWLGLCKYNVLVGFAFYGWDNWREPYRVVGGQLGWTALSAAGLAMRDRCRDQPHSGRMCMRLELVQYSATGHEGKPDFISAGLVLGNSNGRDGKNALVGAPGKYSMTFWLRGDVPEVTVAVFGWTTDEATLASRTTIATDLAPLAPTPQWRQYAANFELGEEVKRFAVSFGVAGYREAGYRLGQCLFVDDVVLVRDRSEENIAPNGNVEGAYANRIAEAFEWALPRGLTPVQSVWPLMVRGWEDGGKLKIRCSEPRDIDALAQTFRISLDRGATWVRLGLDDHSSKQRLERPYYVLTQEADKTAFRSLGHAHGTLIRELYQRLRQTHPHCRLIVSPAYYHNAMVPRNYIAHQEEYHRELRALVPADVLIEWSGSSFVSLKITKQDVDYFGALIGRTPLYWDNSYSNVSLYLPVERDYPKGFSRMVAGVHLCGAGPAYTVDWLRYADYLWNPEAHDPGESWGKAVATVLGEGLEQHWLRFREGYLALALFEYGVLDGLGHISQLSADELRKVVARKYGFQKLESVLRSISEMEQSLGIIRDRSPNTEYVAALEKLLAPYSASTPRLRRIYRGEQ